MSDSVTRQGLMGTAFRLGRLWGFIAFLVFVVVLFREIATPFVFAFALAYVLNPLIDRMAPRVGRVWAVIVLYLVLLGAVAGFVVVFLPKLVQDFTRLREALPQVLEYIDERVLPWATEWLETSFGGLSGDGAAEAVVAEAALGASPSQLLVTPQADGSMLVSLEGARLHVEEVGSGHWIIESQTGAATQEGLADSLSKYVTSKGDEYGGMIYETLRVLVSGVTAFLTKFVITLMLAAYIMFEPQRILRFVRSLIPQHYRPTFSEIMHEIDVGLSGVIRGQLLICLINGVMTYIGLVILGIKYSFLLGLLAGGFSLIPIFGVIISSIPILFVALISGDEGSLSLVQPLLVLAWLTGIHLLEGNVLNPKIIGDSANMHPIVVIFALLAGEQLYGLMGALFAVPVGSIVQTLYLYALNRTTALRHDGGLGPSRTLVAAPQELSGLIDSDELDEIRARVESVLSSPDPLDEGASPDDVP